ncbi:hypothetical protein A2422_00740 [Candidatus Woesebacteria bacterium RIFOXYC1_FULL_31_51]|uniref:Large ribosomal subunit protein uL1 n=1 Tax=Candidatus Woesebacteria bacterium GW2011_GWC2_31_9 TaxID=1618586 RepID=A0A0F9YL89_9BACT|nr:MAG: 50S ribosomal protein L1, large subunit ribosomal protein L1 [Candidatus Woesebacteria bacterium GW2011_GWF1_31_35]KKP22844.1 MAG: hypothetical protein UR11_C0002G0224 [Candidatus Woesebacteria bacterium GW2011_GWC1_30_29]KKP26668.1 MAG: hypothetical protein UR13_C0003G0035 [Candidatus Woesebacteria bacterium GW2011_GWD1_31_12]KKP28092.1 MAG: hypothetical protein UR16_C0001G0113 [Candidatus Woesebacteria bacterium GW2011_GWB1_31_29]KKP32239.1 MAG: hypothetical protein UR21_C0001G0035 [C
MGKTKTAFIGNLTTEKTKTSEEAYREKKERQEAKKHEQETVHVPGLKGGQRVKIISAVEPEVPSEVTSEESTKKTKKTKKIIVEKIRGKKYIEAKNKINKNNLYKPEEAIKLVKEFNLTKFDGTFELHIVTKKQGTTANCTLPFSSGKQKKIEVADDKTIEKLKTGKVDFDILLATAEMMPKLVVFARILGPRGLMPNPKNGTLIKSVKDAEKFSGNTLTLKTEKEAPLIHTIFGKVSQKNEELVKNAETIINALGGSKQIIRAFVKSTMSPSIKLEI